MKKIFSLLVAGAFIITSCSSEDETEQTYRIRGIWHPVKTEIRSGTDNAVLQTTEASECYKKSTLNFKSDNMLKSEYFTEVGNTCGNAGEYLQKYSFDAASGILIIDENEYNEVLSLTDSEMQLMRSNSDDQNGDGILDKTVFVLAR